MRREGCRCSIGRHRSPRPSYSVSVAPSVRIPLRSTGSRLPIPGAVATGRGRRCSKSSSSIGARRSLCRTCIRAAVHLCDLHESGGGKGTWRGPEAGGGRLQSHYLFRDRFGRPGKGNDKGKVETLVKTARRRFMVPIPKVHDLSSEFCSDGAARPVIAMPTCRPDGRPGSFGRRESVSFLVRQQVSANAPSDPCGRRLDGISCEVGVAGGRLGLGYAPGACRSW